MKAIIGLDPGHGGTSSGTYSVNTNKDGLFEKDYALDLCKRINEKLIRNGFQTVLTRTADINPGNVSERARICALGKCQYAVSVHFNGFDNISANGCEVFVPYGEEVANIEVGFKKCLTKYFKDRAPFARSNNYSNRNNVFDKKMNMKTKMFDAVSDNKDYFGFIRGCWDRGISADLLEVCFLTNPSDFEAYIKNVDSIAEGLTRAIVEGFGEKYIPINTERPKPEPRIAPKVRNSGSKRYVLK